MSGAEDQQGSTDDEGEKISARDHPTFLCRLPDPEIISRAKKGLRRHVESSAIRPPPIKPGGASVINARSDVQIVKKLTDEDTMRWSSLGCSIGRRLSS